MNKKNFIIKVCDIETVEGDFVLNSLKTLRVLQKQQN